MDCSTARSRAPASRGSWLCRSSTRRRSFRRAAAHGEQAQGWAQGRARRQVRRSCRPPQSRRQLRLGSPSGSLCPTHTAVNRRGRSTRGGAPSRSVDSRRRVTAVMRCRSMFATRAVLPSEQNGGTAGLECRGQTRGRWSGWCRSSQEQLDQDHTPFGNGTTLQDHFVTQTRCLGACQCSETLTAAM